MTWLYWCITIYLIVGIILSSLTCHMLSDQSIYDDFKNEVAKEQLEYYNEFKQTYANSPKFVFGALVLILPLYAIYDGIVWLLFGRK